MVELFSPVSADDEDGLPRTTSYGVRSPILPTSIALLIPCAVLYNAVLAIANAAGLTQSYATVALTEAAILAVGAGFIAGAGVPIFNRLAVTVMVFGVAVTLHVSIASGSIVLDCARAASIIGVFLILGSLATERQIFTMFKLISILVLVFLVVEIVDTPLYVRIFQPASYYEHTRGVEQFSIDNSGLFRNALGFQSRFSFGLSSHRTASVFIEQVSLANFAGVLCVFLLACFDRLSLFDRTLHIVTAVLIIVTNDSRTSSFLALTSVLGYFVYPPLPPAITFAVMPSVLGLGLAVFEIMGETDGDDFRGRISTTFRHIREIDWGALLGFGGRSASGFMDSGYPYVVSAATIFGLVFLWFLLAAALVADTPPRRRCLFGLNVFMCTNLMIGGTAVFSIKIAAPLWALVGYLGYRRAVRRLHEKRTADVAPSSTAVAIGS